MNKAYLLTICLLLTSFTGCMGNSEDVKDDSPVEEILYEGDEAGECSDEADNDKDGLFDCDDDQCAGSPACKAEDKPKDEKNNTEEKELVKGCMDSNATNYDSEAEVDDNSCEYPEPFQPENRDELKAAVDEWIEDSESANSTYGHISTWDTSLITDMSGLFYDDSSYPYDYYNNFNSDISNWDVSSVTDMSRLFSGAISFNGNISDWDVSSVTDMSYMFLGATSFNGNISDWDVSIVTDMEWMFGPLVPNHKSSVLKSHSLHPNYHGD